MGDNLVDRAVRAALAVAAAHGLRGIEPEVLHERSNVLVRLRPAPVIARVPATTSLVRPDPTPWLATDLALAGFLAGRGAPVVAPSAELPPGPHARDGVTLTFWEYLPHEPGRLAPATASAMLAELHTELREFPGELSAEGPLRDIRAALDLLERRGRLYAEELAALRAELDRLATALAGMPAQPLHGDAHDRNVLHTTRGPLWTDFEDTWRGPVDWDLACLRYGYRGSGYDAAELPVRPDETCRRARRLQAVCWHQVIAERFPDRRPGAEADLAEWLGRDHGVLT